MKKTGVFLIRFSFKRNNICRAQKDIFICHIKSMKPYLGLYLERLSICDGNQHIPTRTRANQRLELNVLTFASHQMDYITHSFQHVKRSLFSSPFLNIRNGSIS